MSENERMANIIARLRLAKDRRGLTYKELAEKSGLSPRTVAYAIRAGRMRTDTLVRLCLALNVSADWVLGLR